MRNSIVAELLAFDECPPDAEYSPFEHGERVGSEISPSEAGILILECWKSLPGTLAASFLEGLLEATNIESLDLILLDSIRSSQEVGSVGAIVNLLRDIAVR